MSRFAASTVGEWAKTAIPKAFAEGKNSSGFLQLTMEKT